MEQKSAARLKDVVAKLIKKGELFSLFKLGLSQIRETSLEDSHDDTQELIVDFLNILKEVADKHLCCPKCHETYTFRVCTGLGHKQDNAIELTCAVCGDYYSCSEKSQHVTYYSKELIKKWKKGESVTGKYISTEDAKIYILDEVCRFDQQVGDHDIIKTVGN